MKVTCYYKDLNETFEIDNPYELKRRIDKLNWFIKHDGYVRVSDIKRLFGIKHDMLSDITDNRIGVDNVARVTYGYYTGDNVRVLVIYHKKSDWKRIY